MKEIRSYAHPTRKNCKVLRLDLNSLGELRDECNLAGVSHYSHAGQSDWWGGDSLNKLLDRCLSGDERYIDAAEQLLDQLRTEIEIPRPQWQQSAWGAFPSVPDFLSGEPDCMRQMAFDP